MNEEEVADSNSASEGEGGRSGWDAMVTLFSSSFNQRENRSGTFDCITWCSSGGGGA